MQLKENNVATLSGDRGIKVIDARGIDAVVADLIAKGRKF